MAGYKRVNFHDLCRLCAQCIPKNKTKIFDDEGLKIQLDMRIKKYLALNVTQNDLLPKVVCSKCIKQLETCIAFREVCFKSETMLSSYLKNYSQTQDFKKSGKVYIYIKDTGKPDVDLTTVPSPNIPSAPPDPQPIKSVTLDQLYTLQLPAPILNNSEVLSKVLNVNSSVASISVNNKKPNKEDLMPTHNVQNTGNTNVMLPNITQLPYTVDYLNEALKRAVQQLPKEILSRVVVNSNGEVINLSQPDTNAMLGVPAVSVSANNEHGVIKKKVSKKRPRILKEQENLVKKVVIDLTEEDEIRNGVAVKYDNKIYGGERNNGQQVAQNPSVIFPVPAQFQNNYAPLQPPNISYSPPNNITFPTPPVIEIKQNTLETNNINTNNIINNLATVNMSSQPSSVNLDDLRSTNYVATIATQQPVQPAKTVEVTDLNNDKHKKNIGTSTDSKQDSPSSKVHICEVCSKTFKRREHLYQHVKLHTGFRPYKCSVCNKTFGRKEHLLRHMVLHSGERNYVCDICTKCFSRHDNLLKHIRTHNKESSYTCEVCSRVFVTKHNYLSHRIEEGKCFLPSM